MGIYDRDYYRDDSERWYHGLRARGVVWLIGITVAVYILQLLTRDPITHTDPFSVWGQFSLDGLSHGQLWRLLTGYFISDPWSPNTLISLAFGMYLVYILGGALEEMLGKTEFLAFYLGAALASSVGMIVIFWLFLRGAEIAGSFGPGAPITALLVLYACYYPKQQIYLMFILPVPIWLLVTGIILLNLLGFFGSRGALHFTGTLSAIAFSFMYYWQQLRITSLGTAWHRLGSFRRPAQPRLSLFRGDSESADSSGRAGPISSATSTVMPSVAASSTLDEQLEARLDQILEKVARTGKQSLTADEHQLLLKASEIYKRRRGNSPTH
jgi:membrane associated rhomboid family serine protease